MGTGFKHGAGGGAPLNFKVVGGTSAPSNAKENTIWVNTSTAITSYVFSATQPTGSTGMVWFSTDTSSSAAFNALKKNGIHVYPNSAKQYVGGKWVDKTAKIYQGGKWVDLISYLYNNGNQYTDLTGGWSGYKPDGGGYDVSFTNTGIKVTHNGGQANWTANAFTKKKIDVSNFTKLVAEVSYTHHYSGSQFVFGIASTAASMQTSFVSSKKVSQTSNSTLEVTVDLSSVSGSYYVGFFTQYALVTVNNIRLM